MLMIGLAACSASDTAADSSATPSTATGAAQATSTGPTATAPATGGKAVAVGWRGATIQVPTGWRKVAEDDTSLCLLPTASPDLTCQALGHTDGVQNWLFLYASERVAIPGESIPDPLSLDASDMGFWMYHGAQEVPCDDWTKNQRVDKANKTVGGKVAYYGKWLVTCKDDGKSFTAQRWLLPKSRLGVVSFALTDASAAAIYQMVMTMDMTGYEPTSP
jgi:hypothetical protein